MEQPARWTGVEGHALPPHSAGPASQAGSFTVSASRHRRSARQEQGGLSALRRGTRRGERSRRGGGSGGRGGVAPRMEKPEAMNPRA